MSTRNIKIGLSEKDKLNMKNEIYDKVMEETDRGLKVNGTDIANNILAFTENKGIYVATDNGGWYYWKADVSKYVYGGVYQATEIADKSVTKEKLSEDLQEKLGYLANEEKDYSEIIKGQFVNRWGDFGISDGYNVYSYKVSDNIKQENVILTARFSGSASIVVLDINENVISYILSEVAGVMATYELNVPLESDKILISSSVYDKTPTIELKGLNRSDIENVKETLKNELQKKINGIIANSNEDFLTITEEKYFNQWGTLSTLNLTNAYEYEITEDLKNKVLNITTKMWGGCAIVILNKDNSVLSYYKNTYNDEVERTYKINIPLDAYKLGISGAMIPIIKLENLVIEKSGGACRIFHDWGVIGDSLSSGCLEYQKDDGSTGYPNIYPYSWGQCMARAMGVNVVNYSSGGQTAKSINESNFEPISPLWNSKHQVYVIGLGTNDSNQINTLYTNGWGSASDIDLTNYNNNGNSFVGWYAKIIQRVRQVNPDCYLFLLTNPINYSEDQLNAITTIASKFNRCFVINTNPYRSVWNNNYKLGGHLSPYGYLIYGDYIMSLISKLILEDESKFKNVGFIGTEYKNKDYE